MPPVTEPRLAVASDDDIQRLLNEARALNANGHARAALLLGWSALEAVARRTNHERLSQPQRPGSVLEMLAFEGYVSPSQADRVRPLVGQRNRLIHGDLAIEPGRDHVEDFISVIDDVRQMVQSHQAD
jgi:uncharacterized protein YutE (UPF0331/DUF86 family)